jgi:3-oxoacyl-(acyl-carrier-protein) synthase
MHDELKERGPRRISPFFIPGSIINMIAGLLSIDIGAKGPNLAMVTACTTSTHCIGEAAKSIRYGDADVMVAGGAEAVVTELAIGGFRLGARAFDAQTTTRRRPAGPGTRTATASSSAKAPARWCSRSTSTPRRAARRSTARWRLRRLGRRAPHDRAARRRRRRLPRDAQRAARTRARSLAIDYINAHGTSTPLGDIAETVADQDAARRARAKVAVNSTKSMTGHLLGAAGGVEAVFTRSRCATRSRRRPSTCARPTRQCDLDYVPNSARRCRSASRCPTRSASAAPTARSSCARLSAARRCASARLRRSCAHASSLPMPRGAVPAVLARLAGAAPARWRSLGLAAAWSRALLRSPRSVRAIELGREGAVRAAEAAKLSAGRGAALRHAGRHACARGGRGARSSSRRHAAAGSSGACASGRSGEVPRGARNCRPEACPRRRTISSGRVCGT